MGIDSGIRKSSLHSGGAKFRAVAKSLSKISRGLYKRGWALGMSGNFSAVVSREPLRLAITQSCVDKGSVAAKQIVLITGEGKPVSGAAKPSDEALLHLALVNSRKAGAVLHTHSIWSTIASEVNGKEGGVAISGYEMLKGLEGVRTHEHCEWLPIIENSQDMPALARTLEDTLEQHPGSHGILLRRHGLYTWGKDLSSAKRHVEILEFLLQAVTILDFGFSLLGSPANCPKEAPSRSWRGNPKFKIEN